MLYYADIEVFKITFLNILIIIIGIKIIQDRQTDRSVTE
jgi:hypothetical protein